MRLIWTRPLSDEPCPDVGDQDFLKGLPVFFIKGGKEAGQHENQHPQRCSGSAEHAFCEKVKGQAHCNRQTETYQLAFCEV